MRLGLYGGCWTFYEGEGWYLDVDKKNSGELLCFYPPLDEEQSYEAFYEEYARKHSTLFALYFGTTSNALTADQPAAAPTPSSTSATDKEISTPLMS